MQKVIDQSGLIVMVAAVREQGADFLGTGWACSGDGHIVTCAHILDLTANIQVTLPPPINDFGPITAGKTAFAPVSIVQIDSKSDLALLKFSDPQMVRIAPGLFGRGETVNVGTSVGCLGVPFGNKGLHTIKLTSTVICGKSTSATGNRQLHLDANMHPGNSGGPVVDVQSGKIIAIISGRFSPVGTGSGIMVGDTALGSDSTISFATPIEALFPLLDAEGVNVQ